MTPADLALADQVCEDSFTALAASDFEAAMEALMCWLNENIGVVTAIGVLVTVAGVGGAWYYAFLTRRLWQTANRQADITQEMFEAGNRPWVTPTLGKPRLDPNLVSFDLLLRNGGTVPADITRWEMQPSVVDGNGNEQPLVPRVEETPVGRSLSPHVTEGIRLGFERGGHINTPYRLRVTIHYRGIARRTYWTTLSATLDGITWHTQPTTRGDRSDD